MSKFNLHSVGVKTKIRRLAEKKHIYHRQNEKCDLNSPVSYQMGAFTLSYAAENVSSLFSRWFCPVVSSQRLLLGALTTITREHEMDLSSSSSLSKPSPSPSLHHDARSLPATTPPVSSCWSIFLHSQLSRQAPCCTDSSTGAREQ